MKESREMTWRSAEGHKRDISGNSSQPSGSEIKCELRRSLPLEKLKFQPVVLILTCSQQNRNQLKACFQLRILKKLKKFMAKFLHCNTISFNAADSGPYYQVMINTIAEAGPGVKDPTGYQISNLYDHV